MLDIQQIAAQLQTVRFGSLARDFTDIVYDPGKHPRDAHGRYVGGDHGFLAVGHAFKASHMAQWLAHHTSLAATMPAAQKKAYLKALTYHDGTTGRVAIKQRIIAQHSYSVSEAQQMPKHEAEALAAAAHVYIHRNFDPQMRDSFISAVGNYNKKQTDPVQKISTSPRGLEHAFNATAQYVKTGILAHVVGMPYAPNEAPTSVFETTNVGEQMTHFFGRVLTEEDAQRLLPGSIITSLDLRQGSGYKSGQTVDDLQVGLKLSNGHNGAEFSLQFLKKDGVLTADVRWAASAQENAAFAGRAIIRAMQHLQSLGVNRVEAEAAGYYKSQYNGYYTWPRLGFDGPIPIETRFEAQERFPGVKSVGDIMTKPGGAAWWKKNGSTFNATFDFTPGSHSRQVFDRLVQGIANRVRLAQLRRRLLAIQEVG